MATTVRSPHVERRYPIAVQSIALRLRVVVAGVAIAAVLVSACTGGDEPPPTTTSAPTTTSVPTTAPPASVDAQALAAALATRDPAGIGELTPLVAPASPASRYVGHQVAARTLIGDAEPATVRSIGGRVEICETPTDCVTIDALETDPATGLLRSFAVAGTSIDGRVTGGGPRATVEDVSLAVVSASRSTAGTLTVIVRIENASEVPVEWFGFAAVYVDPLGSAVEAIGTWGDPNADTGASTEMLIAFPDQPLGGVVELSGLRDDGIDLSVTVVVPDAG